MIITHIGGPTVLIEVDGWRLLTDPTFDPAGGHYAFGWGTSSDKVTGPAIAVAELPPIDAVLLTHDHHGDNLDTAGRELLTSVPTVVTTVARSAAARDAAASADSPPGRRHSADRSGQAELDVIATPARHGPPLSRPIVGDVVGFALRRPRRRPRCSSGSPATRCCYRGLRETRGDHVGRRRCSSTSAACGSRSPVRCATR